MASFETHIKNLTPLKALYDEAGHSLRFVGGCVRDWVLEVPSNDIDLATTLPAAEGLLMLKNGGFTCIPTGMDHGTITVVIHHIPYEITTLRRDVSTDGRRATIHYTNDWQEDAARRDFTFNALYRGFDNQLWDYFGGKQDLLEGRIQFIGNAEDRILEDHLRILRLFRFYARYGKINIDPTTLELCHKHASKLAILSKERITQEITRLLETSDCLKSLQLMHEYGILEAIFDNYHLDRVKHLLDLEMKLDIPFDPRWTSLRRLAALTSDLHLLRLSNTQLRYLKKIHDLELNHNLYSSRLTSPKFMQEKSAAFTNVNEHFESSGKSRSSSGFNINLEEVNILAYQIGNREVVDHLLIHGDGVNLELMGKLMNRTIPEFPLKGQDIVDMGIHPGPKVKKILDTCVEWWCRKEFSPDREECLNYARKILGIE